MTCYFLMTWTSSRDLDLIGAEGKRGGNTSETMESHRVAATLLLLSLFAVVAVGDGPVASLGRVQKATASFARLDEGRRRGRGGFGLREGRGNHRHAPSLDIQGCAGSRSLAHYFRQFVRQDRARRPPLREFEAKACSILCAAEAQAGEEIKAQMAAVDISSIFHSYGKLGERPGQAMLEAIEEQMRHWLNEDEEEAPAEEAFGAQSISNTLWGYAKVGLVPGGEPPSRLLAMLERQAVQVMGGFNAQNVANTIWAYAKMGVMPCEELRTALALHAQDLMHDFNAQNVANLVWASTKLDGWPARSLWGGKGSSSLVVEADERGESKVKRMGEEKMKEAESKEEYRCMGGGVEMLAQDEEGARGRKRSGMSLCQRALQVVSDFNAQNIANVAYGCATALSKGGGLKGGGGMGMMRILDPGDQLWRAMQLQAAARISDFNAQGIANTVYACGRLQRGLVQPLWDAVEAQSLKCMGGFNTQNVANTLWGYATLGREPGDLMWEALASRAMLLAGEMSPQNVANTLWAYATLREGGGRQANVELVRALEAVAARRIDGFSAQGISNVLWSLARMGLEMSPGLQQTISEHPSLPVRVGEMNAQNIANTVWALGVMGVEPGGGMMSEIERQVVARVGKASRGAARAKAGDPEPTMQGQEKAACEPEATVGGVDEAQGGVEDEEKEDAHRPFSEQHVVSMLMALARLRMPPGHTMVKALLKEAGNSHGKFCMRDQANLLWAVAALGAEPNKRLLDAALAESRVMVHGAGSLAQLADGSCQSLDEDNDAQAGDSNMKEASATPQVREQYKQVHAFLLVHEIEGWKDPGNCVSRLRKALGCKGRQALAESEVSERQSILQSQVACAIKGIGYAIEEESRCPVSGYSLDITVMPPLHEPGERGGDVKGAGPGDAFAAVEVNGPTHYLAGGSRVENGATALKRRILTGVGWRLLSVPFWEWDRGSGEAVQQQYVKHLLDSKASVPMAAETAWRPPDVCRRRP